jgi:hypothetical protein
MIYIIGNTLFGYPKMGDIQIDYFKNWLIPYLKKVRRDGDILVHTGNIFFNKQSVNYKVLKDVYEIVDNVSGFMPIYLLRGANDEFSIDLMARNKNIRVIKETKKIKNIMFIPDGEFLMPENDTEYLFYHTSLKEMNGLKRSFNGFYENEKSNDINISIGSPYELNRDFSLNQHGLYEFSLNHNELKLIVNTHSPKFKEIYIEDISELSNININSKDFIDLIVKSKAVEKTENKNKLEIFASKNKINNIYYTEEYIKEENVVIKNNEIRDILVDNADEEIKDNLKEIFTIYDNTRGNQ